MGLDMYFMTKRKMRDNNGNEIHVDFRTAEAVDEIESWREYRKSHPECSFEQWAGVELPEPEVIDFYEKYPVKIVGSIRKANHVHGWIVENVQYGFDDKDVYKFKPHLIEMLIEKCDVIVKRCNVVDDKIDKVELCESILPVTEGFFFGSYDYDQLYYDLTVKTASILKKIMEETDFDNEEVFYQASW